PEEIRAIRASSGDFPGGENGTGFPRLSGMRKFGSTLSRKPFSSFSAFIYIPPFNVTSSRGSTTENHRFSNEETLLFQETLPD
ncbi:MAG: hypothetical protein R6T96_17170, partial [Longimicrobiales bacterium]